MRNFVDQPARNLDAGGDSLRLGDGVDGAHQLPRQMLRDAVGRIRRPKGDPLDQWVLDGRELGDQRRADELFVEPRRKIVSHRGSLART